jgi:hypothetical protein
MSDFFYFLLLFLSTVDVISEFYITSSKLKTMLISWLHSCQLDCSVEQKKNPPLNYLVLSPEFHEPLRLDHFFGQNCVVIVRVGSGHIVPGHIVQ